MDKSEKMIELYEVTTVIVNRVIFIAKNMPEADATGRIEELMYLYHALRKDENVPSTKEK